MRLVCGYRRTGKDTLYAMFNQIKQFKWVAYKRPDLDDNFIIEPVTRISFADALKEEVATFLGLPANTNIDMIKDKPIRIGTVRSLKTFRDFCRELALKKRDLDPEYWLKKAVLNKDLTQASMVTDFRFLNEYEYLSERCDVTTIRLFRQCVPLPAHDHPTERSLDNFATDFLLLPAYNTAIEFKALLDIMPQYKNYVACDIVFQ